MNAFKLDSAERIDVSACLKARSGSVMLAASPDSGREMVAVAQNVGRIRS